MDGRPRASRFCALHAIAELEKLLGFDAGARAIAQAIKFCHSSPGKCVSSYACAEHLTAAGARGAKLTAMPLAPPSPATLSDVPLGRTATIVQLRAAMPAQVVTDDAGNFIERRIVRTDVLRERGDGLAELLAYWHALKGDGRLASFADIDPVRLAQLGLLGRLHVLNADHPDPLRMRFDLYGNKASLDNGRIYTGLMVGDHPVRIQSQTVAADYDAVRRTAEPRYFRVRKGLTGIGYHYARLVLPFSAGAGRVDRLLVAIRPEPDDGVPLNR